jgi:Ig-like domain CHU_C associated
MRSRVVWVVVIGLMAVSASLLAQQTPLSDPNTFVTENCAGDRGLVRTGRVFGAPAATASARVTSLLAFSKMAFRNVSDPTKWPSKVAPTSLTTGEGILYRIDNLEIRGQDNCLDSIVVDFGDYGGFNTPPQIEGLFPSSVCLQGTMKTTVEAAKTVFTDQLSVWGSDLWHNSFEKGCGGGGDGKTKQRVSVIGYGFWDDSGGTTAPTLRLAPIISIIDTSDGVTGGGGDGGTGGGGGGTPAPTTGLTVVLPDDVRSAPLLMTNSSSTSVLFSTFASPTSTADVAVSATSDADDLIVSVNHPIIAAPGSGDEILTIHTTATTAAGDHVITITAFDGTNTASASIFVTVLCDPPFILGIDQPKGSTVSPGRPALLSVKASGSGPFTYQWFTGSSGLVNFPLAGGTTANFTTSAINDTTSYWVRVTNPCGSADSQTATINVSAGAKPNSRR